MLSNIITVANCTRGRAGKMGEDGGLGGKMTVWNDGYDGSEM